jgi:hypothetical protein
MTLSPPASGLSDPFQRNAFRVLGLPGDATRCEIVDAANRLRGQPWSQNHTPWDLPWIGPVQRKAEDVEAALAHLAEPDDRILHRMFWFHDRDAEDAVAYLGPDSIRDALEGWSSTSLPIPCHDAAIVALAAAASLDPEMEDMELWHRALREWKKIIENERYWLEFMKAELAGGFERSASLGDVLDLRESLLSCVADLVVGAARRTLIAGNPEQALRAVEMLREELPPEVFTEACLQLARPASVNGGAKPQVTLAEPEPEMLEVIRPTKLAAPLTPGAAVVEPAAAQPRAPAPLPLPDRVETTTLRMRWAQRRNQVAAWSPVLEKAGIGLLSVGLGIAPLLLLVLANEPASSTWPVEARIELNELSMERLVILRAENDEARDSLHQNLTETRSLLEDYDRRIGEGLPHDPLAYLRLQRYDRATQARYEEILEEGRVLADRYDNRLRRRSRLVAELDQVAAR